MDYFLLFIKICITVLTCFWGSLVLINTCFHFGLFESDESVEFSIGHLITFMIHLIITILLWIFI